MKKILFIASLFSCLHLSAQRTVISGKITNPKEDSIRVSYITDYIDFQQEIIGSSVNKKGEFKLILNVTEPTSANLEHGDEQTAMFLEPGDSLHVTFSTDMFDETMKYSGRGAVNNNFLAQKYLFEEQMGDREAMELKKRDLDEKNYPLFIDSINKKLTLFMEEFKKQNLFTPSFEKYITADLKYSALNNLITYPGLHAYYTKKGKIDIGKDYYSFLNGLNIISDLDIPNTTYYRFLDGYFTYLQRKDSTNYGSYAKFTAGMYNRIKTTLTGDAREHMLANTIYEYFNNGGIPDSIKLLYEDYTKLYPNTSASRTLIRAYEQAMKLAPGNPAPGFTLTSIEGKPVSLNDFKGKVVYLDFWASWCGPCLQEVPHAKELQQKFEGKDVIFVMISVDEDEQAWRKMVEKKQLNGIHLLAKGWEHPSTKSYNIKGIPAYFLIDKEGKISDSNAKRPSSGDGIVADINKLLLK